MIKIIHLVIPLFLFSGNLQAGDGFDTVKCGSDIPKALMGKKMKNDRVVAIEGRHKDLGLKNLGASEVSKNMVSISWLICGSEYMLLEVDEVVRDVLPFPPHSKSFPAIYDGICQRKGEKIQERVIGVFENQPGDGPLPAKQAWTIDEKNAKFVIVPAKDLRCDRSGIITLDGGK